VKPGRQARENRGEIAELGRMSRVAHDLSQGKLPPGHALKMLREAEQQLGLRCDGCGERVRIGFKFRQLQATVVEGGPTVDVLAMTACDGSNPACSNCGHSRRDFEQARREHPDRAAAEGEHWPGCQQCGHEAEPVACEFAMKAKDGATVMEPVEFAWLDEQRLAAGADGGETDGGLDDARRRAAG
jgi:hypothetical protein